MYVLIILAALAAWLIIAVAVAAANNTSTTEDILTIANEGADTTDIVGGYENLVFPDQYDLEYEELPTRTSAVQRKTLVSNTYSYDTLRAAKRDLRHRDRNNGRKPKSKAMYSHHKTRR